MTTVSNARSRMGAFGRVPKALLRDGSVSARAKTVVAIVDEIAGHEQVTLPLLSEWLGCNEKTARAAVREAQDLGWLEVHEQHVDGRQVASLYIANGEPHQADSPVETAGAGYQKTVPLGGSETGTPIRNETYETNRETGGEKKSAQKGGRIPEGWVPDEDLLRYAESKAPALNAGLEAEKFVNYWLSASGPTAVKRDWRRAFQNWLLIGQQREEQRGWRPPAPGAAPEVTADENEERKRQWLAARNLTVEEYEANKHDPAWMARVTAQPQVQS